MCKYTHRSSISHAQRESEDCERRTHTSHPDANYSASCSKTQKFHLIACSSNVHSPVCLGSTRVHSARMIGLSPGSTLSDNESTHTCVCVPLVHTNTHTHTLTYKLLIVLYQFSITGDDTLSRRTWQILQLSMSGRNLWPRLIWTLQSLHIHPLEFPVPTYRTYQTRARAHGAARLVHFRLDRGFKS